MFFIVSQSIIFTLLLILQLIGIVILPFFVLYVAFTEKKNILFSFLWAGLVGIILEVTGSLPWGIYIFTMLVSVLLIHLLKKYIIREITFPVSAVISITILASWIIFL